MNHNVGDTSQEFIDKAKGAGNKALSLGKDVLAKKVGKRAAKAVKKGAVKLAKAIVKALIKLVQALGIWGIVILIAILFFAVVFDWAQDERGSSGQLTQDVLYENPTEVEDGVFVVKALTEPQALIDAYYKYLACDSHQKLYIDPNTGEEITLQFSNADETADFSGLIDLYQKENYFYLSSYFIKMTDELLHNNEFYYPEQIIKPVYAEVLPLESDSGKKYITTLPLVDDGSDLATAIKNNTQAYAYATSTVADGDETVQRELGDNATLDLLATSKSYEKGAVSITENGGISTGIYTSQGMTEEPGVWDYGLGSILQYDAMEKDKHIECEFNGFMIHTHELTTVEVEQTVTITNDNGEEEETTVTVEETVESCSGTTVFIPVTAGDTATSLQTKINAYETETSTVAVSPSYSMLTQMTDTISNKKIEMDIDDEDSSFVGVSFNNSTLNSVFGNETSTYPINVPVIIGAATFSGTIRYEYSMEIYEDELGGSGSFYSDYNKAYSELVYSSESSGDTCSHPELTALRSGSVVSTQPSTYPVEVSAPIGFSYLEAYQSHYKIYVPDTTRRDMDFTTRIYEQQEGSYSSELDADNDGELTSMDFLINLGLLRPYASGTLTAVEGGAIGSGALTTTDPSEAALMAEAGVTNDEEGAVMLLAKVIAAEAGPNKLDQLCVASVVMNRVAASNFPNTLIGVITASGQYASWANGSIQARTPSEQMISSARQVISGEFALPSNVIFQKVGNEGLNFMSVVNGPGYYTHDYSISTYDSAISTVDRFGRTALSEAQVRAQAEALYQSDVDAGISTVSGSSGLSTTTSLNLQETGTAMSHYKLYSASGFDVLTAITNMRKITSPTEEPGFLGQLLSVASEFLTSIFDQIMGFFNAVKQAGLSIANPTYYMMYNYNVPLQTTYDTVLQAMTFSDVSTYSEVADNIDTNALMFLFVGKNGGIGAGTNFMIGRAVVGVGSTFDGFTSPTSNYYQTTSSWNELSGSVTIGVPEGGTVQAVGPGSISTVDGSGPYTVTQTATVDGKSLKIVYGNLASVTIASGYSVSKGDKIGEAGAGGLTLALYVDGANVDPMQYFYQATFTDGAAFSNFIVNGTADMTLKDQVAAQLNAANNSKTLTLDKWHSSPANTKSKGQCTWWAYGRGLQFCEQMGTLPSTGMARGYGNGGDYYDQAQSDFAVGQTARAGSWIVWKRRAGTDSSGNYYGHVAFVEAVEANGDIWISETYSAQWGRKDGNGIILRKISYNGGQYTYSGNYTFRGFVYLDSPIR